MGASQTGLVAAGDYATPTSNDGKIDAFIALIPDPDAPHGSGAIAGSEFLDEMSPGAAAQLRVEAEAIKAALEEGEGESFAFGSVTASADDATANQVDIVTGLANITLANCVIDIQRGGSRLGTDAVITEPTPGTIRVADGGATYVLTAGDVIKWAARP